MTLIVGLKTTEAVVLAADEEETSGIVGKRTVPKLRLIAEDAWAVAVGGAGDAAVIENAMRRIEYWLKGQKNLTGDQLADAIEDVSAAVHEKYIDPDPRAEGISLVVGATCDDGLHLISTSRRTSQFQDSMAYAGIGSDVAAYFIDRLNDEDLEWKEVVKIAGFVLAQAKESAQFCSGDSLFYVLQTPPNPRWRDLGGDASAELETSFRFMDFPQRLKDALQEVRYPAEACNGYCDEHNPVPYETDLDTLLRVRLSASETANNES